MSNFAFRFKEICTSRTALALYAEFLGTFILVVSESIENVLTAIKMLQ